MKKGILFSIALLLQIYNIIKTKQSVKRLKLLLNKARGFEIFGVKAIKEKINEGTYKIGDYVLCKGKLFAEQNLKSLLEPNKKVAYSQLAVEKVLKTGENQKIVKKTLRKLCSGILRLQDRGETALVYQSMDSNIIAPKVFKKTISVKEKIFNLNWFLRIFLKSPTRNVSNTYYEYSFPNGGQCTILAKISQNKSGKLQFLRPTVMAESRDSIIYFYKNQLENSTLFSYSLWIMIIATVIFMFKFVIQPSLTKRNLLKLKSNFDKLQKIEVRDRNCSVCQQAISSIIHNPCGHLAICTDCNLSLNASKCMQCNKKPIQSMILYPC